MMEAKREQRFSKLSVDQSHVGPLLESRYWALKFSLSKVRGRPGTAFLQVQEILMPRVDPLSRTHQRAHASPKPWLLPQSSTFQTKHHCETPRNIFREIRPFSSLFTKSDTGKIGRNYGAARQRAQADQCDFGTALLSIPWFLREPSMRAMRAGASRSVSQKR